MPTDTTLPESCLTRDITAYSEWSYDSDVPSDRDFFDPDLHLSDIESFLSVIHHKGIVIGKIAPEAASATNEKVNAEALEREFLEQAERWDRETTFLSSTPKKVLHESYQRIMAMGPDVVPFLLRDLQRTGRSWFWALRHLTRTNPVPIEDQGNIDKMIDDWVTWGKREGLL